MNETLLLIAAVVVGTVASARFTRLVVHDSYPPARWVRDKWVEVVRGHEEWSLLFNCHWCFAPWVVAPNLAWAILSDLHWSWWIVNGWLAASYAASWIVHHDEDE